MSDDVDTATICRSCGQRYSVTRKRSHKMCDSCASSALDDLLSRELTMHKHLRPTVERHHDGVWINATATLGCVRPELARDYAAELLRAADEADRTR